VLSAIFEVSSTPGAGLLEKVYQRALHSGYSRSFFCRSLQGATLWESILRTSWSRTLWWWSWNVPNAYQRLGS